MTIAVAIGALVELHAVKRVLALRDVALGAFEAHVAALQGIFRGSVLFYREERWLPALHFMAGGTLACISALQELAVVGVLVAVGALGERKRLFEVAVGVALTAFDLCVFSLERILRF